MLAVFVSIDDKQQTDENMTRKILGVIAGYAIL
jgi:hypothetical protein